ncbi:MAG: hypothetical protein DBY06_04665 [Clostridiales bacterium]|nr:MAG: hypothetical protein DBY06_04665 [Clostridiales bacterium]
MEYYLQIPFIFTISYHIYLPWKRVKLAICGAPAGALPLDPARGSAPGPRWGLPAPSRSSQRSLRVAAKAASFNSLAHWASASLFPPLAALGSCPPWPAFEKAGENQLVNFFGFPAECAGPPLIGSGGLVWSAKSGTGKWALYSEGWKEPQRSRGGGGRAQRAQSMGGAFGPRPCFGFAGPSGPQNAAAPRRAPNGPLLPHANRASGSPTAVARRRRKAGADPGGAAAFGRPGGPMGPPGRQTK